MGKTAIHLLAAVLISCLPSCYNTRIVPISDVMNKWIGHSEQDLILKFGPPTSVSTDGDGGKVLSYEKTATVTMARAVPVAGPLPMVVGSSQTVSNKAYMQFFIGRGGRIYNWRTNYPDIKEKVKRS